jgi:hypothetical protein
MARQKQKKKRNKKRVIKGPDTATPAKPSRSPFTEAWKGRTMQGAVRRGERQPGRSS